MKVMRNLKKLHRKQLSAVSPNLTPDHVSSVRVHLGVFKQVKG